MEDEEFSCEEMAEAMRKRHRYRQMIRSGKLVLPHQSAARLLGPDCLYQLYSRRESENPGPVQKKPTARRRKTRKHRATLRNGR